MVSCVSFLLISNNGPPVPSITQLQLAQQAISTLIALDKWKVDTRMNSIYMQIHLRQHSAVMEDSGLWTFTAKHTLKDSLHPEQAQQ